MKNLPLVLVVFVLLFGMDFIASLALVGFFHLLFHTIFTIKVVVVFAAVAFVLQMLFFIVRYK